MKNRIIKFRGISEKGKWHYGWFFINQFDEPTIFSAEGARKVSLESVGQFTGLLSKSGKEIYEGDITKVNPKIGNEVYQVQWNGTDSRWQAWRKLGYINMDIHAAERSEVIGNIWENPELVETTNKKDEKAA